jgi:hypothetical protein
MDGNSRLAEFELARLLRSRGLCPTADESLVVTSTLRIRASLLFPLANDIGSAAGARERHNHEPSRSLRHPIAGLSARRASGSFSRGHAAACHNCLGTEPPLFPGPPGRHRCGTLSPCPVVVGTGRLLPSRPRAAGLWRKTKKNRTPSRLRPRPCTTRQSALPSSPPPPRLPSHQASSSTAELRAPRRRPCPVVPAAAAPQPPSRPPRLDLQPTAMPRLPNGRPSPELRTNGRAPSSPPAAAPRPLHGRPCLELPTDGRVLTSPLAQPCPVLPWAAEPRPPHQRPRLDLLAGGRRPPSDCLLLV